MSQTANDEKSTEEPGWADARNHLFRMIMEGRSFSGRERNCCFLNTGSESFAKISAISGLDFLDDARCIAVTDWDSDGDQDLWISNRNAPRLRLMRNDTPSTNRFVAIRLVGDGKKTNRDAIGARVEVVLPGIAARLIKTLRAGEGFLSQSSKWLHFGLGQSESIERIIVNWPGGDLETFSGLQTNKRYRLHQGSKQGVPVDPSRGQILLSPGEQVLPVESRTARVVMQTRLPMPQIGYRTAEGNDVTARFESGKATLLNLWASWCQPCIQELNEFSSQTDRLKKAGVNIVSLSVDQLGNQPTPLDEVSSQLKKMKYPHVWGFVDESQMNRLQELHNQFFFLRRPLPLPTSFLIDDRGQLSVIYRGPVSVDQVIADANRVDADYIQTAELAACLPGHVIAHSRTEEVAKQFEIQTRYLVASWLVENSLYLDAIEHFEWLARSEPEWAVPQIQLARLHLIQGDVDKSMQLAQRALQFDPKNASLHNTLGNIYSKRKIAERATQHFLEATRINPEFAEAHNNLGTELAQQGQLDLAGHSFQRAVQIDDQFAQAHTNLGSFYAAQNDIDRAMFHYRKAIDIDSKSVDAHNNLGTMFATKGNLEEAIRCYERALKIEPKYVDAQRNLERAQSLLKNHSTNVLPKRRILENGR